MFRIANSLLIGTLAILVIFIGAQKVLANTFSVGMLFAFMAYKDQFPIGSAYRAMIGVVMQDDQLFAGSLADNVSFFSERPDRERVEECARLAAVHDDIIAMPMAYETLMGDMGTVLSGGQKQLVLIARALYRRPAILLLDEATSHLDVGREKAVNEAIRAMRLTRIIVAHRPETIRARPRHRPRRGPGGERWTGAARPSAVAAARAGAAGSVDPSAQGHALPAKSRAHNRVITAWRRCWSAVNDDDPDLDVRIPSQGPGKVSAGGSCRPHSRWR
ncbi:MAG: ATP-binding cassette domain-containing protein [Rhodospirillales bacterium]|nr:ATP-binding cassette domain-containing protein [Rhodospirillales bacterium]